MGHSIAEMQTEHGEIRRLTDTPMSRRACGWHRDYKLQYNCQQMGNGRSNTMGGEKICPQVVALPPNSRTSPNFPGWNMCTQSTTSTTSRLNCTLAVLVATNQFLSSSIRSSTCLDPSISTRHQSRQCRLMSSSSRHLHLRSPMRGCQTPLSSLRGSQPPFPWHKIQTCRWIKTKKTRKMSKASKMSVAISSTVSFCGQLPSRRQTKLCVPHTMH
jgi:hypothetical protein